MCLSNILCNIFACLFSLSFLVFIAYSLSQILAPMPADDTFAAALTRRAMRAAATNVLEHVHD